MPSGGGGGGVFSLCPDEVQRHEQRKSLCSIESPHDPAITQRANFSNSIQNKSAARESCRACSNDNMGIKNSTRIQNQTKKQQQQNRSREAKQTVRSLESSSACMQGTLTSKLP